MGESEDGKMSKMRLKLKEAKFKEDNNISEISSLYVEMAQDLRAMLLQDLEIWFRAKALGIDPKNTFRGFFVKKGDDVTVHITTLGDEGEQYAKQFFETVTTKEFIVRNKTLPRFGFTNEDDAETKRYVDELKARLREYLKKRVER